MPTFAHNRVGTAAIEIYGRGLRRSNRADDRGMEGHEREARWRPGKLAAALVRLVDSDEPPHRFIAGADAMEGVQRSLTTLEAQIEANRYLSASRAHED